MSSRELAALGLHEQREALPRHYAIAFLLALVGGILGIAGAIIGEVQSGGWLLLPLVGAPIIEEAMKPVGVYIGLIRWPETYASRLYTAFLAAMGGFVFGVIEAFAYTQIYVSDPSDAFVVYRFTAPLAMHTVASFIFGLGISRGVVDWAAGRSSFPRRTRYFYIAAVLIHAVFNGVAATLQLSGAVDFD